MTRVNHRTTADGRDGLAISLGLLSAVLSVVFVAYLFFGALLSWGSGPDWSVSLGRAFLGLLAGLAPCFCIAGLSIAALRATRRPGAISPGFSGFLAIPSLLFSILVGGLFVATFVGGAKNPNRALYPLHDAACKADLDAVRIQLKRGVSAAKKFYIGSPSDGRDALGSYFQCFKREQPFDRLLVDELLGAGADINAGQDAWRSTALETAVLRARPAEQVAAVKYLVSKGATVNSRKLVDRIGLTDPRMCEIQIVDRREMLGLDVRIHLDVIDVLFDHGFVITKERLVAASRLCLPYHRDNPIVLHIESQHRDKIVYELPQTPSK